MTGYKAAEQEENEALVARLKTLGPKEQEARLSVLTSVERRVMAYRYGLWGTLPHPSRAAVLDKLLGRSGFVRGRHV